MEQVTAGFECTLEAKIQVKFTDEKKAHDAFIESDWKETFYELEDLEDVARHLAYAFYVTAGWWNEEKETFCKLIEGFGNFYRRGPGWTGGHPDGEAGEIVIIEEEDLAVSCVDELD